MKKRILFLFLFSFCPLVMKVSVIWCVSRIFREKWDEDPKKKSLGCKLALFFYPHYFRSYPLSSNDVMPHVLLIVGIKILPNASSMQAVKHVSFTNMQFYFFNSCFFILILISFDFYNW